jgi:hypothetical protein
VKRGTGRSVSVLSLVKEQHQNQRGANQYRQRGNRTVMVYNPTVRQTLFNRVAVPDIIISRIPPLNIAVYIAKIIHSECFRTRPNITYIE